MLPATVFTFSIKNKTENEINALIAFTFRNDIGMTLRSSRQSFDKLLQSVKCDSMTFKTLSGQSLSLCFRLFENILRGVFYSVVININS